MKDSAATEDGENSFEVTEDEIGLMLDIHDYLHSAQKFGMGFLGFAIGILFGHLVIPELALSTFTYLSMAVFTAILDLSLLMITPRSLAEHSFDEGDAE